MNLKNNFLFAFRGLRYAFEEPVFRTHCVIGLSVIVGSFVFRVSRIEFVIVLMFVGWMLSIEIINTIIEHVIDLLKPEFHEQAKVLKDLASGAVLVSSFAAAAVGLIIFLPKLHQLFLLIVESLSF